MEWRGAAEWSLGGAHRSLKFELHDPPAEVSDNPGDLISQILSALPRHPD